MLKLVTDDVDTPTPRLPSPPAPPPPPEGPPDAVCHDGPPGDLRKRIEAACMDGTVDRVVIESREELATLQLTDRKAFDLIWLDVRQALGKREANHQHKEIEQLGQRLRAQGMRMHLERLGDELTGLPEFAQLSVPPSYRIHLTEGIVRTSKVDTVIAPSPLVIVGRSTEMESHDEWVELAWMRDGQWRRHRVARMVIADHTQLLDLAAKGAPVTSQNARALVEYLAEFESVNLDALTPRRLTRRMGWQSDGFVWGQQWIGADSDPVTLADDLDDGKLVSGFASRGTLEGWRDAVSKVSGHPQPMLAIYAALASAMLLPLDADNFVVDWSNPTSTGKTTLLRVAASVWGRPDERGLLYSWNSTKVALERMAGLCGDLPLILDDTKKGNPDQLNTMVYQYSGGHGRGRGSKTGLQKTATWRGVMLSTGENQIANYSKGDGGAHARVLSIWSLPFGEPDESSRELVNRLKEQLLDHHGHAGAVWVRFINDHRDQWPHWRERYVELRRELAAMDPSSGVADRLASYMAVIALTAELATPVLQLPCDSRSSGDPRQVIDEVMRLILPGVSEADRALAALEHIVSWATENAHRFQSAQGTDDGHPVYGTWYTAYGPNDLTVLPHLVQTELRRAGFTDSDAIVRTWADRDWLECGKEKGRRRLTKKSVIDRKRVHAYVIRKSALEALGLLNAEPDEEPIRASAPPLIREESRGETLLKLRKESAAA